MQLSLLLAVPLAAAATARMVLPEGLVSEASYIELTGFGGHNRGTYHFTDPAGVEYRGAFTRNESRLGVFDPLYVRNRGHGAFDFDDPLSKQLVRADCEMKKVTLNFDVVTFDKKKLAYQCEFRADGHLLPSRLAIGQPKREGLKQKMLARDLRAGEAALFGGRLRIESVHHYQASKLSSQAPVGYLLFDDERAVAAVELTDWNPGIYLAPGLDAEHRRSVLMTALAIAVFRDPALSALEDE